MLPTLFRVGRSPVPLERQIPESYFGEGIAAYHRARYHLGGGQSAGGEDTRGIRRGSRDGGFARRS